MRGISVPTLVGLCGVSLLFAQSEVLLEGLKQFHNGDLPAAEAKFRKVLESGDNSTARAFLALTEAGTGRCALALPELGKQTTEGPDAEVRRLTGLALVQCQMRTRQFDEAFQAMGKLRKLFPGDADVLYQSARLYMEEWNDTVREMFEKTPASFRVNELSAEIFETQSRYDAATGEYSKALAKSPNTVGLHFRLGRAILMQSHEPAALSEARKEFEAELALNPYDAAAEYEVAQILMAQQKPEDAVEYLRRAVELAPDFPEALIALAKSKSERGQNAEAIALLEHAVKLVPRSEAAHVSLMMAYRNAGRINDAQAQKAELDKLMKPPEGEFSEFLKKLGEKNP